MSDPLQAKPGEPGVASKDVNVLIATPCYGGVTHVLYNQSVRWLMATFQKYGIRHQVLETSTESLIPRARNAFASHVAFDLDPFGDRYTHLLFIDADIGFHPDNIIQAIGFDKDIVALPYPCKDINWSQIIRAVQKGVTEPDLLSRMGSRPIVNTNGQAIQFNTARPTQFPQLGTGALLIKREVLLKFAEDPARKYTLMAGERKFGSREFGCDFFQIGINPETRYYDSEDYRFCLDARKMGFETWMLPWAITNHTGNYTFVMDIQAQSSFGIPELDPDPGILPTISVPSVGGICPPTI